MLSTSRVESKWCLMAAALFACPTAWSQTMTVLRASRQVAYIVELPDCSSSNYQSNYQSDCFEVDSHGGCATDLGEITGYVDQRTTIGPNRIAGWGFVDINASQLVGESEGYAQSEMYIRFRLDSVALVRLRADINGHRHPDPMKDFDASVYLALHSANETIIEHYASRATGRLRPDQIVELAPGDYEFIVDAVARGWNEVHYSGFGTWQVSLAIADCPTDLNFDGATNLADLAQVLSRFSVSTLCDPSADVDQDGIVGLSDVALVLANFGTDCDP